MSFNKSPLSRLKRSLSLQSCFPEVRSAEASGCKSPDDNASSVNGGRSFDDIRHNVDTCLDIDDQGISPASSGGKTSTASRRIFPLESRSPCRSVSDIQNSKSELLQAVPEAIGSDAHVALDLSSWPGGSTHPKNETSKSDASPVRQAVDHSFPLASVHYSGAISGEIRSNGLKAYVLLCLAALNGDWKSAKAFLESNPQAVRARITRRSETALHIAAGARHTRFVEELVKLMKPDDLALQNKVGNTALCFAAASGITRIAEVMVNKNRELPMIRGSKGVTPLYMAALVGHKDMVRYLYSVTEEDNLTKEDRIGLLVAAITANLFVPGFKSVYDKKLMHIQALELVQQLWDKILSLDHDPKIGELIRTPSRLLFTAAELGIVEFITVLIRSYPDLIWKVNDQSQTIFHVAVAHRQEKIFNLIYEIGAHKDYIAAYKDEKNNNMLHLAGKLAPSNRLKIDSGAAFQLQRELHWFKEVEKIIQPSYTEMKNEQGRTPQILFTEEHKDLVREGEKWMKDTASSCMVVATLIATVMFAAAFSVPGGNDDDTGRPIFLTKKSFLVFAISDALALFSSATSILIFLSILTSRYAEEDFLESLPNRLIIGLATLFISVATMMIAFCATLFIVLGPELVWVVSLRRDRDRERENGEEREETTLIIHRQGKGVGLYTMAADSSSVDVILDFLRRNRFTRAEAALRSELGNRPDLNGFLQKLTLEEKADSGNVAGVEAANGDGSQAQGSGSKELVIVKEIECGERNKPPSGDATNMRSEKNFAFSKGSEDTVLDLYTWKFNADPYRNEGGSSGVSTKNNSNSNSVLELQVYEQSRYRIGELSDAVASKADAKSGEEEIGFSGEKRGSWVGSSSEVTTETNKYDRKELDQKLKSSNSILYSKGNFADNPWSEPMHSSSDQWKNCSIKTVFPFSKGDVSTSYDNAAGSEKKDGKRKAEMGGIRAAIKEQVDEVGRALYFGKSQGSSELKTISSLNFPLVLECQKEELPRLPPVKLKSEEKPLNISWEEKFEHEGPGSKIAGVDNAFLIGSYLDVPIGQEINSSGGKRTAGGSWLSVSQGIAEDTSDLVSGFATVGDGLSESIDYPNEYWDSDEYDDDDDVGYMRQPIEDETWFLAHEIDYPSDNEKGTGHGSVPDPQERGPTKDEDDDQSFAEEDSYFSGEQYFPAKHVAPVSASDDPIGLSVTEMYGRTEENDLIAQYDGQLMDEEELNLMRAEPVWQGFVTQTNELIMLRDGKVMNDCGRPRLDDNCMDDDQHGSVRSIGVGINSDAADIGSEVRESLVGGSSEGDLEYFHDQDIGSRHSHQESDKKYNDRSKRVKNHPDGGFSFPPPLRDGQLVQASSSKSLWSNNCNAPTSDETDDCLNALMRNADMLASWRRKSSDSSPVKSSKDENNANAVRSENSSPSTLSNYGYNERGHVKKEEDEKTGGAREEDPGVSLEDEEAAAVQEQVRQIKAQEEEFETFNLKIVHRKNRTGFEEDKNFHVVLNSVIAGRYHVTEYLGSAAFSKAIQAHDLHTGMDVCVKIIKNNKDFFDQSLDEIKLLKFVNKNDPADKYHILRLYDYFYYREHLLIVCELLKANLYEFHKFNRESGGEVYFTMPRLQSITIQCLEALQFLHGLGLIHCDLKPENILVKSYSRCEVKVIDLGSSCFETDHLCSYVQSRSYRAPEVILGLPYDKKIDVWSLGCILAELCTGNVLFQNDSPATLLARVIGIIGSIDQGMLAKGRDTYKYFTKNHMLYERNQDTNRLEYLIPKKTSLRHRLPMGDQGFIDFVSHMLEINPKKRPSASEALKHPWLSYPYEPISS
uniref:Protein kinase domain-containing protein n=1 Tax=Vitis vinifera TaxID=29760 RepID=F6HF61_VITVI